MNWLQLGYQYGVGGLFFAVTLILCSRGASSKNASDRQAQRACLVGLAGYLLFHIAWIVLASR